MKIFLSWSGEQGMKLAEELSWFLRRVLQQSHPFVSSQIPKGSQWMLHLTEELNNAAFCILCITPSSLGSRWAHFEAGAVWRGLGGTNVCPYLLGVTKGELTNPFAAFQAAEAHRVDTLALVESLNAVAPDPVDASVLRDNFAQWWPEMERRLAHAAAMSSPSSPPARSSGLNATSTVSVREVFRVPRQGRIAGCLVVSGTLQHGDAVHVLRNGATVAVGRVARLRRFKEDVPAVGAGYECGVVVTGYDDIVQGDEMLTFPMIRPDSEG